MLLGGLASWSPSWDATRVAPHDGSVGGASGLLAGGAVLVASAFNIDR